MQALSLADRSALNLAQLGWRFTAPGAASVMDDPIEYPADAFCGALAGNRYLMMQGPQGALQAYSPAYVRAADFLFGGREPESVSGDPRLLEYRRQLPDVDRQVALRVAVSLLDQSGLAVETALRDVEFSRRVLGEVAPGRLGRDAEVDAGLAFATVSAPGGDPEIFHRLHQGVAANFRPEVAGDSIRRATGLYESVMRRDLSGPRRDEVVDVLAALVTRLDPQDWDLAVKTVVHASADHERWPTTYLQLHELAEPRPVDETVLGLRLLDAPRLTIVEEPDGTWLGSVFLPREE